jgi:hypothetical protein
MKCILQIVPVITKKDIFFVENIIWIFFILKNQLYLYEYSRTKRFLKTNKNPTKNRRWTFIYAFSFIKEIIVNVFKNLFVLEYSYKYNWFLRIKNIQIIFSTKKISFLVITGTICKIHFIHHLLKYCFPLNLLQLKMLINYLFNITFVKSNN